MPVFTSSIEVTADYPTIKPSLNLNFARSRSLDPRITFERASVGTYVGRDGLVKTAGEDEARFDHDPDTLESLGLLIEESRTNNALYSDDFNDNTWVKQTGHGLTSNTTIAPDGTQTADTFNRGATNQYIYQSIGITGTYTMSVWVKTPSGAGNLDFVMQHYNTTNGSLGTTFTATEEWQRFHITVSPTVVGGWYPCIPTTLSQDYHVWGAQVEEGSFPTSYIPTSASAVTRAEDKADIRGDAFQSIFNSNFNEFSGVIEFDNDDLPNPPASYYSIFELWGENTNFENRIQITRENDGLPWGIETRAFGSNTALFSNGNISGSNTAALKKLAFSWKIPDYSTTTGRRWAFSFSGETVDLVPNNSGAGLPQVTRMGIGYSPTRNEGQSKTYFKRITIYPKALTDAQLQLLTS